MRKSQGIVSASLVVPSGTTTLIYLLQGMVGIEKGGSKRQSWTCNQGRSVSWAKKEQGILTQRNGYGS